MRFCTECGAQNTDESKFCVKCGERMYIPKEEQNPKEAQAQSYVTEPEMSLAEELSQAEEISDESPEKQPQPVAGDSEQEDINHEPQQDFTALQNEQQIADAPLRTEQQPVPPPQVNPQWQQPITPPQVNPQWQQPIPPPQVNSQWQQPAPPQQMNQQWQQYGQQGTTWQALSDPLSQKIKAVGKSPAFLIGAILYSLIILVNFSYSVMSSINISGVQVYYSVDATASVIAGLMLSIIAIIPALLIMVGLWKVFAFAHKPEDRSVGGLTLIKASSVITLIFEFIGVGAMLLFATLIIVVASASRAPSEIISIVFIATAVVVTLFTVMIIYSFLIIKTLNSVKSAVLLGIPKPNGITGLIIFNIIIVAASIIWLIITVFFDGMLYPFFSVANDVFSYVGGSELTYLLSLIIGGSIFQSVMSAVGILVILLFTVVLCMYKKAIRTHS